MSSRIIVFFVASLEPMGCVGYIARKGINKKLQQKLYKNVYFINKNFRPEIPYYSSRHNYLEFLLIKKSPRSYRTENLKNVEKATFENK